MAASEFNGFEVDIETTWSPSITVMADLLGGGFNVESELAAWDAAGNLAIWIGTSGRTIPSPNPMVSGNFTVSSVSYSAGPPITPASTTITGSVADTLTLLLSGNYKYQWDLWDSYGSRSRLLEGSISTKGRSMS